MSVKFFEKVRRVLLLVVCGLAWGVAAASPALCGDITDPLSLDSGYTVAPKHQATITYMDRSRNFVTFRGQGTNAEGDLSSYWRDEKEFRATPEFLSGGNSSDSARTFAVRSRAGKVLADVVLDDSFYGVTDYANIPTPVLTTFAFYKRDDKTVVPRIMMQGPEGNLGVSALYLSDYPEPLYIYRVKGDAKHKDSPPIEKNVATDMVAHDWNDDGYTDYVVCYPHNENGNNKDPSGSDEDDRNNKLVLLYIDGREAYDTLIKSSSNPTVKPKAVDKSMVFGNNSNFTTWGGDVRPAGSARMAAGDVDGDGLAEIAVYHTQAGGHSEDSGLCTSTKSRIPADRLNFAASTTATMTRATVMNRMIRPA